MLKNCGNLPSFSGSYFQWESWTANEIYIIVKDTAKVDKVMRVDRLHCVAYLFLKS